MAKILAIDDKKGNLITLSAILRGLIPECSVITTQSGLESIEKVKTESPDTILLDIKMPDLNGYEVCKRLKEDTDTQHIPVILISAILTGIRNYSALFITCKIAKIAILGLFRQFRMISLCCVDALRLCFLDIKKTFCIMISWVVFYFVY